MPSDPTRLFALMLPLAAFGPACSVLTDTGTAADAPPEGIVLTIDASDRTTTSALAEVLGTTTSTAPTTTEVVRLEMVGVPRGLNLRSGPGGDFPVITGIEKDRVVEATGDTDSDWTEVRIDGLVGWMASAYLVETDRPDPGPAPATTTTTPVAGSFVVVDVPVGLNIRSGPGASYDRLGGAVLGATVEATGVRTGGWVQITHDGVTGWVDGRFLAPA